MLAKAALFTVFVTVYGDCPQHNKLISSYIMLYFTCVNRNSLRPIQIFPGPAISDVLYPSLFQTNKHDDIFHVSLPDQ